MPWAFISPALPCKTLALDHLLNHVNHWPLPPDYSCKWFDLFTSCYNLCQRLNKHFTLYHFILRLEFLNIVHSLPKPFFLLHIHVIIGNLLTFLDDILCFYPPLATKLDHFVYRTLRLFMYNSSAFSIHYTHSILSEVFSKVEMMMVLNK
jgi:hypothetical protein